MITVERHVFYSVKLFGHLLMYCVSPARLRAIAGCGLGTDLLHCCTGVCEI